MLNRLWGSPWVIAALFLGAASMPGAAQADCDTNADCPFGNVCDPNVGPAGTCFRGVDLSFSPASTTKLEGTQFQVNLIAKVATGATPIDLTGLTVILDWDPTVLQLVGLTRANEGFPWFLSEFSTSKDIDGMNDSFLDGDAYYTAQGPFLPPRPQATLAGLVVTTFIFNVVGDSEGGPPTQVAMPLDLGGFNDTKVILFDDIIAGVDILRNHTSLSVTAQADCNNNGVRDLTDIANQSSKDCNLNTIPDKCEIDMTTMPQPPGGPFFCNPATDACDPDCDGDGRIDRCQINQNSPAPGGPWYCNPSASLCDADCNVNGIVDACESDCDCNLIDDACDLSCGMSGGPCDVPGCGTGVDRQNCGFVGRLDDCEVDCHQSGQPGFGTPDACDIFDGIVLDVNPTNGIPDECEFLSCSSHDDCDDENVCTHDACNIGNGTCQENLQRKYGDVNFDQTIDIFDILCVLDGFAGVYIVCSRSNVDLAPCPQDQVIDVFDILGVLDAFAGLNACSCTLGPP
ncbi:MAG: hypothetical protein HOP29_07140 [Phycisphaerales bacterium]|nr:hypothetical protein [Phycisphaerales bacterium]